MTKRNWSRGSRALFSGIMLLAMGGIILPTASGVSTAYAAATCDVPSDGTAANFITTKIADGSCTDFNFTADTTIDTLTVSAKNDSDTIVFNVPAGKTVTFDGSNTASQGLRVAKGNFTFKNLGNVEFKNYRNYGFNLQNSAKSKVIFQGEDTAAKGNPVDLASSFTFRNINGYNIRLGEVGAGGTALFKNTKIDIKTEAANQESAMNFGHSMDSVTFDHTWIKIDNGGVNKAVKAAQVAVYSEAQEVNLVHGSYFQSDSNWYYNFSQVGGKLNIGSDSEMVLSTKEDANTVAPGFFGGPHPIVGLNTKNTAVNVSDGASLKIVDNVPGDHERHGLEFQSSTVTVDNATITTPSIGYDWKQSLGTPNSSKLIVKNSGRFIDTMGPEGQSEVPSYKQIAYELEDGYMEFDTPFSEVKDKLFVTNSKLSPEDKGYAPDPKMSDKSVFSTISNPVVSYYKTPFIQDPEVTRDVKAGTHPNDAANDSLNDGSKAPEAENGGWLNFDGNTPFDGTSATVDANTNVYSPIGTKVVYKGDDEATFIKEAGLGDFEKYDGDVDGLQEAANTAGKPLYLVVEKPSSEVAGKTTMKVYVAFPQKTDGTKGVWKPGTHEGEEAPLLSTYKTPFSPRGPITVNFEVKDRETTDNTGDTTDNTGDTTDNTGETAATGDTTTTGGMKSTSVVKPASAKPASVMQLPNTGVSSTSIILGSLAALLLVVGSSIVVLRKRVG